MFCDKADILFQVNKSDSLVTAKRSVLGSFIFPSTKNFLLSQQILISNILLMGITDNVWLPTEEELTVQEVPLSGPALKAGAFHLGKACEFENNVRLFCYLINLST